LNSERSYARVAAALDPHALTAGLSTSKSENPLRLSTRTVVMGVRELVNHGDVMVAVVVCTVAHTRRDKVGG